MMASTPRQLKQPAKCSDQLEHKKRNLKNGNKKRASHKHTFRMHHNKTMSYNNK